MTSSSKKSASKAKLLDKRKLEDDLETKPILKKHKENETRKEQNEGRVELSETNCDQANLISVKEPDLQTKTLFVANLYHRRNEISPIIDFFKDVGQVVRLRLVATHTGKREGSGFVEFASANEAKKVLEKKNGEYLRDRKIILQVANKETTRLPLKYCVEHTVRFNDYPQREEDATPPDFVEAVLFVANLSPQTTKIIHIIDFFKDVAQVVSVRLIVNHEGKHVGCGFVEFASSKEGKRALKIKNGEYLHDHKILLMKGHDKTSDSVEAVDIRNKTLFVSHLSRKAGLSDIIDFFKDVGQVARVRLRLTPEGKRTGRGFVEFASADEAKKALEKKNGKYLHKREIFLDVANKGYRCLPPKYCLDYTVWYEDYLRGESLVVEEDATEEGLDETPEDVAVREKTVFVANLPKNIRLSDIIKVFEDVGEVVSVRLVVDDKGERVDCCFVEFASAEEAKLALQEKKNSKFFRSNVLLKAAEIASPYPFRPKYNLHKLAKKLWYEDNILRREGLGLVTKEKVFVTMNE